MGLIVAFRVAFPTGKGQEARKVLTPQTSSDGPDFRQEHRHPHDEDGRSNQERSDGLEDGPEGRLVRGVPRELRVQSRHEGSHNRYEDDEHEDLVDPHTGVCRTRVIVDLADFFHGSPPARFLTSSRASEKTTWFYIKS